jgi:quercetin dioxygenase-like cupin family protein
MPVLLRQDPANPEGDLLLDADTAGTRHVMATLGTIPPGLRLPAHFHPNIENVLYLTSGRLIAYVGEDRTPYELRAGNFLYLAPGEIHALYNPSEDEAAVGLSFYSGSARHDERHAVMVEDSTEQP